MDETLRIFVGSALFAASTAVRCMWYTLNAERSEKRAIPTKRPTL
jgi:hypothetical protein